jgi:hypothetical protein
VVVLVLLVLVTMECDLVFSFGRFSLFLAGYHSREAPEEEKPPPVSPAE